MERPFPAYRGNDPYVFVSYSHEDDELVYPEIEWLHGEGFNIWYDEGISPGSRWSDALARALSGSSHFVFLVTPNSAASQNCTDEVGFALEKGKPLLAIHLAETELPDGLALRLGSRQAIMKYVENDTAYRAKVTEALGQTTPRASATASDDTGVDLSEADRIYAAMAVLPFDCRTEDPDLELFAETVAEEIAHLMVNVMPGKRLLAPSETATYARRNASSREIAAELEVGMVVRGNLRKAGDKVRITVELTRDTGEQLWSHRFDVPAEELASREDRIIDMIVDGVDSSARTCQRQLAFATPVEELGPWGLYSKMRATNWAPSRELRLECRSMMERAIELDPHPVFLADTAFIIANGVMEGFSRDREADTALARKYAERAASSQHTYPLMAAGGAFIFLGEHERGLRLTRLGYEKAPRWGVSLDAYAMQSLWCGEVTVALEKYKELMELGLPGQGVPAQYIAQCHAVLGNLSEGLIWARQAVDVSSGWLTAQTTYANLLARADRIDEAAAAIERIKEMLPGFAIRKSINTYRRLYGAEEAREAVTSGLQKLLDMGYE